MSPEEIIAALMRVQKTPPVAALSAAGEHRAELTPRLLASLAEAVARPAILEDDGDLQLPFFAMYLLAAWREPQAHPLLLGFLRLPGEQWLALSGDIVTEDMDRMLAQTAGSDPGGIVALVRDPAVNAWARVAAIKALVLLTVWGELPRENLVTLYRDLIAAIGPPESLDDPGPVLGEFVCSAIDLQLHELRDELLALMDRGWIDEKMVGNRDAVAADFDRPPGSRRSGRSRMSSRPSAGGAASNGKNVLTLGRSRRRRRSCPRSRSVPERRRSPIAPHPRSAATIPAPAAAGKNTRSAAADDSRLRPPSNAHTPAGADWTLVRSAGRA